jgi:hypothetical protein
MDACGPWDLNSGPPYAFRLLPRWSQGGQPSNLLSFDHDVRRGSIWYLRSDQGFHFMLWDQHTHIPEPHPLLFAYPRYHEKVIHDGMNLSFRQRNTDTLLSVETSKLNSHKQLSTMQCLSPWEQYNWQRFPMEKLMILGEFDVCNWRY